VRKEFFDALFDHPFDRIVIFIDRGADGDDHDRAGCKRAGIGAEGEIPTGQRFLEQFITALLYERKVPGPQNV
jgi:hypothetical protein